MRFLIADDERLARVTLRSMIEALGYHPASVSEAENGQALADKAVRLQPDCALVDIRMPVLNGFDAIGKAGELCPDTLWILITGYADFDYARTALKLQAFDYLVKPLAPQELKAVLDRSLQEHRCRAGERAELLRTWCRAVGHGADAERPRGFSGDWVFGAGLFLPPDYLSPEALDRFGEIANAAAQRAAGESLLPSAVHAVISAKPGVWVFSARRSSAAASEVIRPPQSLLKEARDLAAAFPGAVLAWAHGSDPEAAVAEVRRIAPLRILAGELAETALVEKRPPVLRLAAACAACAGHYHDRDIPRWRAGLRDLETLVSRALPCLTPAESARLDAYFAGAAEALSGRRTAPDPTDDPSLRDRAALEAKGLAVFLKSAAHPTIPDARTPAARGIVDRVIAYVESNYMRDLGVAEVAAHLRLSPNYLSARFKQECGQSLVAFLTSLRMAKARELLAAGSHRVAEVGRLVGYRNPRHFSAVYRRFYGTLPSGKAGP